MYFQLLLASSRVNAFTTNWKSTFGDELLDASIGKVLGSTVSQKQMAQKVFPLS